MRVKGKANIVGASRTQTLRAVFSSQVVKEITRASLLGLSILFQSPKRGCGWLSLRNPTKLTGRQVPHQGCRLPRGQCIHVKCTGTALFEIKCPVTAENTNDGSAQQRFVADQQGPPGEARRQCSDQLFGRTV